MNWEMLYDSTYDEWRSAVADLAKSALSEDLLRTAADPQKSSKAERIAALEALQYNRHRASDVSYIAHVLSDPDPDVREEAMSTIACWAMDGNTGARAYMLLCLGGIHSPFHVSRVEAFYPTLERYAQEWEPIVVLEYWKYGKAHELPSWIKNPRAIALVALADASGSVMSALLARHDNMAMAAIGEAAIIAPNLGLAAHLWGGLQSDSVGRKMLAAHLAEAALAAGDESLEYGGPGVPQGYVSTALAEYARQVARIGWDKETFGARLESAHEEISALALPASTRWEIHQEISRVWQSARAERYGVALVRGVFPAGTVPEESLFSSYPESVHENLPWTNPDAASNCVIGVGCEDLEVLRKNPLAAMPEPQDFGWKDGYGEHIEVLSREDGRLVYRRSSLSGRTHYALVIDEDDLSVSLV